MKIAVLTSGGVDSSVALRLLKEQGHDVTAFYLKIWLEDEVKYLNECPWQEDLSYVQEICSKIDVPLEIIPMQKEYFDTVVKYMLKEIKAGRTPNPDVMCNNNIKFGLFMKKRGRYFDKVATGHYAQIVKKGLNYYLKKSPDKLKDQTYFLASLQSEQLKKLLFPIGHLEKAQVRALAEQYNLPNKSRKDSQGICFLGKFKYNDFLNHYLNVKKGELVEYETGKKIGEHQGFWYYTVGQRKGIKLPDGPWFVVKKDAKNNRVYISKNYYSDEKRRDTFNIKGFNWFSNKPPKKTNLQIKLRHGENLYDCKITWLNPGKAKITLNINDQGIAPGQFAVFYDKDTCLGSAVII